MNISFQTAADPRTRMWNSTPKSNTGSVFASIGQQAKAQAAEPAYSVNLDALSGKEEKTSARKTDPSLEEIYDQFIEEYRNGSSTYPPGGIATKTPINWYADGTASLTKEQADQLKATYDLSHMDKESYWNLMADLTNLNVISARDIASQCVAKLPDGVVTGFTAVGDRSFGRMEVSGNLMENLSKYKKDLVRMMDWLKNNTIADSNQFFWMRDNILHKSDYADRFVSIFEQLI